MRYGDRVALDELREWRRLAILTHVRSPGPPGAVFGLFTDVGCLVGWLLDPGVNLVNRPFVLHEWMFGAIGAPVSL
ncbi:hypothetical protein [Pikeienuella sp. HZG-20]|uniref:hypothetical protein n=1 Tax=Paludibacillus litoralis TaxID=3133267 RepID=UPI0030EF8074